MATNKNKYYKHITITILVMGMLIFSIISCTKDFEKINTPTDKISVKNINKPLLGQAFALSQWEGMFGNFEGLNMFQVSQNLFSDLYSQYFSTIAVYFDTDQYIEVKDWVDWWYPQFYRVAALELYNVDKFTKEHDMPVENAIAKIWKVELYHRQTDYFGPIIYSDFGNEKTSVAFDSQEKVYHDFFKILDEAVVVLKQHVGEKASFGSNDLVYSGNVDRWLVFANSLRLRLAMRLVYIEPSLSKQESEKAVLAGVMMNNSDNANVSTNTITPNPLGEINTWGEFRMSATMESVLSGFEDPRLSVYFSEAKVGGGYKGVRNGLPRTERNDLGDNFSQVGKLWWTVSTGGSNPPIRVMCASEMYFLRAEGALRGWNMGGTAIELYNQGIRTSMGERTNATSSEIEAYISSTNTPTAISDKWNTPKMSDIPVVYQPTGGMETQLEQIITQKWIALYPDGWEAWAERRRTGYPRGLPLIESLNPMVPKEGTVKRLTFPLYETTNNSAAVEAARKLLNGPDEITTRLWWDAKP